MCIRDSHHADDVFTSFGSETVKKFSQEELTAILNALADEETYGMILRAKGMLESDKGEWLYLSLIHILVGAGCGDPALLSLKGKACIEEADCILYDRLIDPSLLSYAKADCKLIYVGKENHKHTMPQAMIQKLLVDAGRTYPVTVRLKGGDPYVFGRGEMCIRDSFTPSYQSGTYQKKQYALPYESVPTLMYVNRTLLEKEGISLPSDDWTWADFYDICRRVTKDTNEDVYKRQI